MNQIKILKKNINTFQGKINFVTYLSAVVLLVMHLLFLVFYTINNIYIMNFINSIGILVYGYYTFNGLKREKIFAYFTYAHVLIYAILAIICFGWTPGFYLWFLALTCAYFLPAYGNIEDTILKRPMRIGIIYVIAYFVLGFLCPSGIVEPIYQLSKNCIIVLFGINSIIAFFTIITFTYFFTTRQRFKEIELRKRADYDNLTGLKNRNAINQLIDKKITIKDNKFSVAILDIDFFKHVNDTYGHAAGDYILKEIAKLMNRLEGFGITCGRWGGEEFIIVGPNDMKCNQFIDILNDLRQTIKETKFAYERSIIKVTVSIGGSEYHNHRTIKDVIKKADNNLYKAKQAGRNKTIYL